MIEDGLDTVLIEIVDYFHRRVKLSDSESCYDYIG
jgi:hypothetical protein